MLIAINEKLVIDIGDTVQGSRDRMRDKGEALRQKIITARQDGSEDPIDHDAEVLLFILELITHDRVHRQHESIEQRKKTLYNISRTVSLLSHRSQVEGEPEHFREKYYDSNERRSVEYSS